MQGTAVADLSIAVAMKAVIPFAPTRREQSIKLDTKPMRGALKHLSSIGLRGRRWTNEPGNMSHFKNPLLPLHWVFIFHLGSSHFKNIPYLDCD